MEFLFLFYVLIIYYNRRIELFYHAVSCAKAAWALRKRSCRTTVPGEGGCARRISPHLEGGLRGFGKAAHIHVNLPLVRKAADYAEIDSQ